MASTFLRFLDHTQRRTTVGRTPLDEWSARHRDLYLTTHNTHNRQTSMPSVGFEPMISASERPQTYALDRAATGTGNKHHILLCFIVSFNDAFIYKIIHGQYKTYVTNYSCEFKHSTLDIMYGFENPTLRPHNKFGSYCPVCLIISKGANLREIVSENPFWIFNCNACFERMLNRI